MGPRMRLSEFRIAVRTEFGGAYGDALLRDLVLTELGGSTGDEALAAGAAPQQVWAALCEAMDVPLAHRHGAGRPEPRR